MQSQTQKVLPMALSASDDTIVLSSLGDAVVKFISCGSFVRGFFSDSECIGQSVRLSLCDRTTRPVDPPRLISFLLCPVYEPGPNFELTAQKTWTSVSTSLWASFFCVQGFYRLLLDGWLRPGPEYIFFF